MSKELVISSNRHETRVAIVEDDQVVEVYHQRENEYSLAGSIHKGRVTRVLPGMQSAFVDIGLDRDAFLYVSDFFEDNEEYDKIVTSVEEKVLKLDRTGAPQAAAAPAVPEEIVQAVEAPEPVSVEPPAQMAAAPTQTDAPQAPFGGRGDRDGRGRRSRRRRGGKGGSALPDSKFYSPREASEQSRTAEQPRDAEAPRPVDPPSVVERHIAAEPPAAVRVGTPEADDDFFVLPGESLAKYSRSDSGAPQPAEPEAEIAALTEEERAEVAEAFEEAEAVAPPEAEPAPQLEAEAEVAPVAVAEPEAAEAAPEIAPAEPEAPAAHSATEAEEASPESMLATEPAAPEATADSDAEAEDSLEIAPDDTAEPAGEDTVAVSAEAEAGDGEAVAEGEGPEPARIPTSLTAALREQNPRYQHRVSRRMRRKGGRGPFPSDAERPPQQEPRVQDPQPAEPRPAPRTDSRTDSRTEKPATLISDLLREGQEIIVQIAKEPLGAKGARITSHIALPGRFLVYMPTVDHIGVSRKIPSDDERLRLKRVLQAHRTGIPGGYIVRTAGEGRSEEELRADMMFLYNLWLDMRQKAERKPAPLLIHHDLNVVERVLRDQLTSSFKSIWADNEEIYESVLRFVQRFQPALVSRVKLYTRSVPIFEEFGITSELEKALRPKVWMKSGGYIVINQTEALVAIDVNTGKFVGKSNRLEDTIVKTNTDAIKEIVRQIRLRDLGGIIVVDFIDMDERKNRQKVMQALEEAMRSDRAPYKILQFNDFGLVAITRKRVKQSLERTLCTPCPYCEGAGYVKSPQTVVGEILQEAHKIARAVDGNDVMLRVNPEVAKLLKSNQNTYLPELEEILGRTVIVKSDAQLHQEKFDLA